MEIRSFNQELQFANLLFARLFSNITIEKTINGKKSSYMVKCQYGNRSRIYKNLQNPTKRGMYSYPILIYERTGISRDPERVSGLHNEILRSGNSRMVDFNLLAPNPINIDYSVYLISNFASDNDLIMGNFIPFFNSDLFVTCKHPKFAGLTYNSQVIMSDSITEEHPDELANDAEDITVTTFNFTFKTYIFGGNERALAGLHKIVRKNDDGTETTISASGFVPTIDTICVDFHDVPRIDPTNLSTVTSYSFDKYFQDIESGELSNPVYDSICWKINGEGVLTNEAAARKR